MVRLSLESQAFCHHQQPTMQSAVMAEAEAAEATWVNHEAMARQLERQPGIFQYFALPGRLWRLLSA